MVSRANLTELSKACKDLLFFSERLSGDNLEEENRYNDKVRSALRKIVIANEISRRMIICVTGLQGTGKTTLIKNYFKLDDDFLNISVGRGEQLPILFTSKRECPRASLFAVGIQKRKDNTGYEDFRIPISAEEFKKFSAAEKEDESRVIMYLDVTLPADTQSACGEVSWMLLPGYERRNDYWNSLIEFSVQCSDTAVLVLTPSAVSSNSHATLISRIKERFGDNLIYVLSHSDEQADDNQAIKKALMDSMNIQEEDRVICTGAYLEEEKNAEWRSQLQRAINAYANSLRSLEDKKQKYILSVIRNELKPAWRGIKKVADDSAERSFVNVLDNSSVLEWFDDDVKKMKDKYEKALKNQLERARQDDLKKLRDLIGQNPFKDGIKRSLFGSGLKEIEKTEHMIDDAMQDENGYRYKNAFAAAIVQCTDSLLANEEHTNDEQQAIPSDSSQEIISLQNHSPEQAKLIVEDISTLLSGAENSSVNLKYTDSRETIRTLVDVSTKYFCVSVIDQLNGIGNIEIPPLTASHLFSGTELGDEIRQTQKFMFSILGVAGLDILEDGVLNFVPKLATCLGISPVLAGGGTLAIMLAGSAMSIIKDYHQNQLTDYASCCKTIGDIYGSIKSAYLNLYDEKMDLVRERLSTYLVSSSGIGREMYYHHNAVASLNRVRALIDDIQLEIEDSAYDLTALVK